MDQSALLNQISEYKIIPVVKLERPETTEPLMDALVRGGLPVAEITLRTSCALECIRIAAEASDVLLGAGTVLNVDQAKDAVAAGASFIVSPGLDEATVEYCLTHSIPVFPGVATATEIQRAYILGVRTVKFFPAEANGGVKAMSALAGPFHQMKFVPTGGIHQANMADYLSNPSVLAVGGSWMVKPVLFQDGDFCRVLETTQEAVHAARIIQGS